MMSLTLTHACYSAMLSFPCHSFCSFVDSYTMCMHEAGQLLGMWQDHAKVSAHTSSTCMPVVDTVVFRLFYYGKEERGLS